MLQWKITAPRTLTLCESAPTALTEVNNTKVKIEHILYNLDCHMQYNSDNSPVAVPCSYAVGVVSETLDNTLLTKMDRVLLEPSIPCGVCHNCNNNNSHLCANACEIGRTCDGVLSNFVDVPSSQLHRLPDQLSYDQALVVPYVSLGINIMDMLQLRKGEHVAVLANSRMGLIVAQLISYYKAVPILISNNTNILDIAKNNLGIFYTFNSDTCDINREIQVVTGGRMCSEVVYLANSGYAIGKCLEVASKGATICVSGNAPTDSSLSVETITANRLTINGVYSDAGNYQTAINLIITGQANIDDIVLPHLPFAAADTLLAEIDNPSQQLPLIIDVE